MAIRDLIPCSRQENRPPARSAPSDATVTNIPSCRCNVR